MIAITGHVRFAIAGVQLLGTFAAAAFGGVGAAMAQERRDVEQARSALGRADHQFHVRLQQALDERTPSRPLEPLARIEFQDWSNGRQRSFIIDRLLIEDLGWRTNQVDALTATVAETETAVELDLSGQLGTAIGGLRQDIAAAHAAGVGDAGTYDDRSNAFSGWATTLVSPNELRKRLAAVGALGAEARAATSAKIAADQAATDAAAAAVAAASAALQAARDNASYQHDRAHGDLAQAVATGVLRVGDIDAAIAAIDARQPQARAIADLIALGADYAYQARQLENVLVIRQSTYNQLAAARSLAARAAGLGVDVGSYRARLDAANAQLDAAPDTGAILAVADAIRNVANGLNAAYSNALAHPPPPPGSVVLNVPYFAQIYSLSCEEAALQMALAFEGINHSQDDILNAIGVDRTPPQVDGSGRVIHWGDPYANFVGDPNGYRESASYGDRSGYGTYFSTIARAATGFGGHVLQANEGIKPNALYDMLNNHHPSVVWVAWEYSPHPITTYVAYDGRTVMYGAPWEHAVTLIGMSPGSVLINNPHGGQQWISKATFEHAYEMFNQMAVIVN
ncbi:MAG TPA: C39 family peptidase [Candidatus Dormibacteraeota bacterium]|jgi:uncharacterized protein YvpB